MRIRKLGFPALSSVSRTFFRKYGLRMPGFSSSFLPVLFPTYFFPSSIPAVFSYYNSSTVVQVPWLPEVNEGHVTPKGWKGVPMHNRKLGFSALFSMCFRVCCVVLNVRKKSTLNCEMIWKIY